MLNAHKYRIQFTIHKPDGTHLTDSRVIEARNSEELNQGFIDILKNEYPDMGITDLSITEVK